MKRLFYLFFTIFILFFTSCEKEPLFEEPQEQFGVPEEDTLSLYGKYLLLSGKMYVTNLETNQKTVYNHFDSVKTTSTLRYFGSIYNIEEIEQNVTTWEFKAPPFIPGTGEFILNNDTLDPYGFKVTNYNWTITEHPLTNTSGITQKIGGSARPIYGYLLNKADSTVMFRLHEEYQAINGQNCKYVSELKFKKI
tara:strand:- start:244 stop:825 length:582 start_codon:yes stop_codon:yes gene_type:complete